MQWQRWKNRKNLISEEDIFFFYLKSTFLVLSIKSFLGFTIVPARGIEVDLGIFVIFFTIVITKDVWAFLLFLVISLLLLKKRCLLLFLFLLLNKKYLWLFLFRSSFSSLLVQAIALVPSKNPIKLNLSSLHIFTRVRFPFKPQILYKVQPHSVFSILSLGWYVYPAVFIKITKLKCSDITLLCPSPTVWQSYSAARTPWWAPGCGCQSPSSGVAASSALWGESKVKRKEKKNQNLT